MDQSPDGCFPSHTLWIPGAGDPRELGIFTGCICSGGRTFSLELATEVPPGISTLITGLKTPLTLAGGVLIGLPVLTFMCLFCCFCFKAAASAAHELPCSLEEKNQTAEGTGCLVSTLFDVGTLPAFIKPSQAQSHRLPGGELAGARL